MEAKNFTNYFQETKTGGCSVEKIAMLFVIVILISFYPTLAEANTCKLPKSYYKNVSCTSDSRYFLAVKDSGTPVALLNKLGKQSADLTKYQKVLGNYMSDGLIPVMKNSKVGYINGKGVVAIPAVYDKLNENNWARRFNNSRVVVKKKGNWGVINTVNKVIIPFSSRIDNISDFSNRKAEMFKSGKPYRIGINGSVHPLKSSRKPSDNKGKRTHKKPKKTNNVKANKPQKIMPKKVAKKNTEISLSDDRVIELLHAYKVLTPNSRLYQGNEEVILNKQQTPPKTSQSPLVTNDTLPYSKPDLGMLDSPLEEVKPSIENFIEADASRHRKKMFPHSKNGKWGFVDVNGVDMITYAFDEVAPFSNELAAVKVDGNWGFINKAGDLVINFRFSEDGIERDGQAYNGMPPFMFFNGKAWVGNLINGDKICINTQGSDIRCA